ncbi:MAG: Asr1405/Asl0597 family protein [Cyanobacteria bacterium J06642_2]
MEFIEPNRFIHVIDSAYSDRWAIRRRLEELSIEVQMTACGKLAVCVNNSVAAAQLRSVIKQFQATRSELITWLESCLEHPPEGESTPAAK